MNCADFIKQATQIKVINNKTEFNLKKYKFIVKRLVLKLFKKKSEKEKELTELQYIIVAASKLASLILLKEKAFNADLNVVGFTKKKLINQNEKKPIHSQKKKINIKFFELNKNNIEIKKQFNKKKNNVLLTSNLL